jgi:hypothetical protein
MPARDIIHNTVLNALISEGWKITHDPLYFRIDDDPYYIDIGAEKIIAAERAGQKIAVEIKSFLGASFAADFHLAVGQFVNYRIALQIEEPDRILYLAIPHQTYRRFFHRTLMRAVIEQQQLRLIVFDIEEEVIVQWIE